MPKDPTTPKLRTLSYINVNFYGFWVRQFVITTAGAALALVIDSNLEMKAKSTSSASNNALCNIIESFW